MLGRKQKYHVYPTDTGYKITERNTTLGYLLLAMALSLVYGGVLAALPLEAFRDRENYLRYASTSLILLDFYWSTSPLAAMANEPLWLLLNAGLAEVFSPETSLRLIIFLPASLVAWNLLRQDIRPFIFLIIFLLLPSVIVHHICMLRQGVAIAIFLTGWFSKKKSVRVLLIAITPFIHSSFFIVLALILMSNMARRIQLGTDLRTMLFVSAGLIIGGTLGWTASFLGARQAEQYNFSMGDVTGLGFIFWAIVLIVMCLQGRIFVRQYAFEIGTILFFLATYFITDVTARIFESTLPLVLIAGGHLTGWRRHVFYVLIVGYGLYYYTTNLNQPWMGWGVS